jgi:hypothetical protein
VNSEVQGIFQQQAVQMEGVPKNFFKHNTISSQSISQLASHTSTMQLQRNFQAVMRLCAHVKFLALEQIPEADRPLILVHV